ncbi:MAG TPA: sigma-70 family RNA polymerase sigma factor [Pirellulales bacterium]|nr:sigma-70 family RNA polymerase sigma factor [Pirellulales bacterium]
MSTEPDSLPTEFAVRLREGDEQAAQEIFDRFARRLVGLARTRLSSLVRQQVDPEDIVQSTFRSFFVRHAKGDLDVRGWKNLWSLLAVITLRKCGHRTEYFYAACRDLHRQATSDSQIVFAALAREPTPVEAAVMTESLSEVFATLDARDRSILEMKLQGESVSDISSALGCTERTVQRVLQRVREWLVDRIAAEP